MTILIYLLLSIFIDSLRFKKDAINIKDNIYIKIYFLLFLVPILAYYALYFKQFPMVQLFITGNLIDRPDMDGSIPHFFTVSVIVAIIIPSIYFFYFDKIKSLKLHFFINIILVLLFVPPGHKGFVIYYAIFMWLYIFKGKIDLKLFLVFIFLMFLYMITKGITEINSEIISYMMNSPFRRFFVTQGACFIHRIDMINEGFDFINNANIRGLKFDVFAHMYNTTSIIGSAPTFYTGDFLVKY
jgi:hypothetical protein